MRQVRHVSAAVADSNVLRDAEAALVRHMLASMDIRRTDRLWPADPMVFQTNPLNVAYGACGTALFLHDALGELPSQVCQWLQNQPVDVDSYPPGLYSGIAGVAWSFAEMGMVGRALELFRLVPRSPLAFKAPDILNGVAGWGLTSLALYMRTLDERLLNLACQAGAYLQKTAESDQNGVFWRDADEAVVKLGFGLGGSGVALFLLYLWWLTHDSDYLRLGRRALEFELAHAKTRNDVQVWGRTTDDEGHSPYWLRGSAGVAAALIRFGQVLNDESYLERARVALRGCCGFSAAPHAFEGLASMGESLLDMFLVTGESFYLNAARQKAMQTLLYRVEQPEGTAFPGRYLLRISHDYALGGAGIGLFIHRLLQPRARRFHDILLEQGAGVESTRVDGSLAS